MGLASNTCAKAEIGNWWGFGAWGEEKQKKWGTTFCRKQSEEECSRKRLRGWIAKVGDKTTKKMYRKKRKGWDWNGLASCAWKEWGKKNKRFHTEPRLHQWKDWKFAFAGSKLAKAAHGLIPRKARARGEENGKGKTRKTFGDAQEVKRSRG